MNTSRLRLIAGLLAASALMPAQSRLQLKVFTSSPDGYSVNSTLVYGDKDAILIDSQFLLSEAHRLTAMILESKKNLTTVYVTHPHPDHYFGLAVIKQAFPNARLVALPATVAGIKAGWGPRYKFWRATHGDNVPADPVIPEELQGDTLTLEGQTLEIVGGLTGDSPKNNSYVWIPSMKAVVAGDIVFSGAHFVVSQPVTNKTQRDEWVQTLDQIAALHPVIVIAGHQIAGAPTDASSIEFMKEYMEYFDQSVASSKSADELREKMKSRYPNLGLETLPNSGSQAAFPAPGK
jgi:glyoxylase-like metal-dependent hydrolase (beta-lactamase superfamily II)